ncbi:MAG: hypothetical protein B6D78_14930, partial [gamma proteobacterium symbiont of Ctena orbiculata]
GLEESLKDNIDECARLIRDPNTYVYLAGQDKAADMFNNLMAETFGSADAWNKIKSDLTESGRWAELLYH